MHTQKQHQYDPFSHMYSPHFHPGTQVCSLGLEREYSYNAIALHASKVGLILSTLYSLLHPFRRDHCEQNE